MTAVVRDPLAAPAGGTHATRLTHVHRRTTLCRAEPPLGPATRKTRILLCFADGSYDDRIVLATAYAWHWDLQGTQLSKAEYRAVLLRLFGSEGFRQVATNEPNDQEDPANQLLVRIGPRVTPEARARFLALLKTDPARASALAESPSAPWKTLSDSLAKGFQVWSPTWWLAAWSDAIVSRTSRPSTGAGGLRLLTAPGETRSTCR